MTKLKLNKEYARRHGAVALLMCALFVWFAYDGLVVYPRTPARELYVSIENAEPPPGCDLEAFKTQKTRTQYLFAALAALAALVVGGRLARAARLDVAFDDKGFAWDGRAYAYRDIEHVDDRAWKKKGISVVTVGGRRLTLDSWHHTGVPEMHAKFMV
ncbi:MAG TPA: hypothetical protein DD637_00980 [Verrucomicrobia bacterium]|nr:hypothetical protein [Verrucomicrobiota bacterium]HCG20754.1 hypothetical protein [Verrucomicrobiota bacterium]